MRISSALRKSLGNKSGGTFFLPKTVVTLYLAHIVKFQQQYIFFIVPDAVGIFFSWSLKNGHFANNSQSDIICPLAVK
jgi:hypothetical protein